MSNKYKRLFAIVGLAKPGKGLLTFIACLSVIGAGSSILFPMLTQNLVDSFSNATEIPTNWILFIAGALALGSVASGINYYLIGKLANRMLVNLRSKVLGKAIYLPIPYFDENNSAEPASRIVNDTEVINSVMAEHFEPFISGMLTLISSLIILWILDWQLTSVLFATLLLSFLVTVPIASKLAKLSKDIQQQEADFLSFITERLSQIRLIKASAAETQSLDKSKKNLDRLYQLGQREVRIGAVMAPIAGMTIITTLIVILAFGAARVSEGIITMGTLIAFILYLFNIVFPLIQFTYFVTALNKAAGAADRVTELLDEDDETENVSNQPMQINQSTAISKDLSFENIQFGYGENNLFNGLNLTLPGNKTIAFVGESGSGKSTLFSLLLRYYELKGGAIKLGDIPIHDVSLTDWRNLIALVPQDTPLISGSIKENLVLGLQETPSDQVIEEALQKAQLLDFVSQQEKKLETQVGERGVKLSGGQKQRLAIARAILQDSPILLCDEATSNLDSATEFKIQQAMEELTQNRTTLIAAHRLSTVMGADKIVVMKSGEILGEGTHIELLNSLPYYQELVELQLKTTSSLEDKSPNMNQPTDNELLTV